MPAHTRLQVLYDPLSYIAGWESVAPTLPPRKRSALNAAMIRRHALASAEVPHTPEQEQWVERLMRHWACVPAAAYLLACSQWSAALPASRLWVALEPQVHSFLHYNFPSVLLPPQEMPRSPAELLHWGGQFVATRLPVLPPWLGQRLQLRFRPVSSGDLPTATPLDVTCFSMALAYAQKDSRFSRSVRK